MSAFVHPTAVVDPGALVGEGTRIWHFAHVMSGARIGAACVLGQNVFVGAAAVVGDGCRIQNNVSVYDGVELGPEVFVGPSAVFTNVANPRAFVARRTDLRPTRVGRGATIGANATVICGAVLGEYCLVAAGAVVTRDVSPYALVAGVPARRRGWVCRCGETLRRAGADPVAAPDDRRGCAACGAEYLVDRRPDGGETLRPVGPGNV